MIQTTKHDEHTMIVRPGVERLTAVNAKAFKDEVIAVIDEGSTHLIIDFQNVSFLDSSGLGALTGVLKRIGHRGDLFVCGLNSEIEQMFKICRMDRVFKSFPDVDASLQVLNENS
jgi:anti-sigma B factor antagonist